MTNKRKVCFSSRYNFIILPVKLRNWCWVNWGETPSGVLWLSEQKQKPRLFFYSSFFSFPVVCLTAGSVHSVCRSPKTSGSTVLSFDSLTSSPHLLFFILSVDSLQSGGVRPDHRWSPETDTTARRETHTLGATEDGWTHVVFVQGEVVRGQHSDSQARAQRGVQEAAQDRLILQRQRNKTGSYFCIFSETVQQPKITQKRDQSPQNWICWPQTK